MAKSKKPKAKAPKPVTVFDDAALARLDPAELGRLARYCWDARPDIEQAVKAALDRAVKADREHSRAWRAFNKFLAGGGRLAVGGADPHTARLHRAIYLMSQQLFEISVQDPALRCGKKCRTPEDRYCPSRNDASRSQCPQGFVFPYLHPNRQRNIGKAARAVAAGFEKAEVYTMTVDSARMAIQRFPTKF